VISAISGSASARAFDLQCEGSHYRIDLKSREWCEETCATVSRLDYRGADKVLLSHLEHFALWYDTRAKVLTSSSASPGDEDVETFHTRCRVMKFSGFPAQAERLWSR
jgi:hypothetical protein